MKTKTILFTVIALFLMIGGMGCQQQGIDDLDNHQELFNQEIDVKYQKLFNISKETESFILANDEYKTLKKNLSGFDKYKDYYIAHGNTYQPDYSAKSDNEAIKIACVEYIMSQKEFLQRLNSKQRKELLCLSLEKQKIKFSIEYSNPTMARQTGLQLIIQLLVIEKEKEILQSISDYCDKHEFEYGIYNDKKFNDFLIEITSNHCNK